MILAHTYLKETESVYQVLSKDPIMHQLIQQNTLDLSTNGLSVFESIIRSIISQQLSIQAAKTIYHRFLEICPANRPETLIDIPYESLRGAGLSHQKALYIMNTADYFIHSKLSDKEWYSMEDEDIINALVQIKGVGRWTVHMMLMFCMGRDDVYAVDDLVIRERTIELYGLNAKDKDIRLKLLKIANQWRPYRSIGCRYLWASKNSGVK